MLISLSVNGFAGLRGPGKYNGVVVFDRWDSCILFSGTYLMYISQSTKEGLRQFRDQAIELDALEVVQERNPGDGRIGKYNVLGPTRPREDGTKLDGIVLRVESPFAVYGPPNVTLLIRNDGDKPVSIDRTEIGICLLAKKHVHISFAPSDGPSHAVITRVGVVPYDWESEVSGQGPNGSYSFSYSYSADPHDMFPAAFTLKPGESKRMTISFQLPPGEYEFLFGYGGGVHEETCLVSNRLAFDVNDNRIANLVGISQ
jgi:hypothetical protein